VYRGLVRGGDGYDVFLSYSRLKATFRPPRVALKNAPY
jgi:hypothetical protein